MDLEIKNLTMTHPKGKKALKNVNIKMNSPSLIGLIGPNGAGKSTLMKLLVSELSPTEGQILLDGIPLTKQEQKLKSMLGYLPQSFGIYDELTVWQFLDYIAALKGIKNSKIAIDEAIAQTNLEEKRKVRIRTLSGGQRQRLGIAQALLGNPQLLILDEPTVGLDPEERVNFRNLFSRTAQDKLLILSTHIIEDVQSICDRLLILHSGEILFDGSPEDLIKQAQGHVGTYMEAAHSIENIENMEGIHITSRVNTANGLVSRLVAHHLPDFCHVVEPTLEDAYMYFLEVKAGVRE